MRYIREYRKALYTELLTSGRLNNYLAELNEEAETMLFWLVKELAKKEGVTETLKAEDDMKWTQAMSNIRNHAKKAEAILDKIGLPVSVLIDTLYRQIIMTGGVPYSLTIPKLPTRDSLTDEQFNRVMEKGYNQAKFGEGLSIDEAFSKIREGI